MVRRLSGLLVLLLLWDFAAAPTGVSALDRGYDTFKDSGFAQGFTDSIGAALWAQVQAVVAVAVPAEGVEPPTP